MGYFPSMLMDIGTQQGDVEGQRKVLLCLAAECCEQAYTNAISYSDVGAMVYFKWAFNLFEINGSPVKLLY